MTKTKKIGRPKLPKTEARSIMLSTRVNANENKVIQGAIRAAGEDKTVWLRNALLQVASAENGCGEPRTHNPGV
jgi:hypothetical protein